MFFIQFLNVIHILILFDQRQNNEFINISLIFFKPFYAGNLKFQKKNAIRTF